jgi:hypothetical protein
MVEWCGVELSHHWSFGECLGLCIILIFCGDMFEIRDSVIHGKGLFTTSVWYPGVALPHTKPHDVDANPFFFMNELGSKVNHSYTPTARLVRQVKDGIRTHYYVTNRVLPPGTEVTVNYDECVPDFGASKPGYV